MNYLALAALLAAVGCASTPSDYPTEEVPEIGAEATVPRLSDEELALLRASCNGGSSIEIGSVGVTSTTYPCEILRTYAAIEATEGRGFIMGALPRFFLKTRLVTKGIFSMFAGLVGLG